MACPERRHSRQNVRERQRQPPDSNGTRNFGHVQSARTRGAPHHPLALSWPSATLYQSAFAAFKRDEIARTQRQPRTLTSHSTAARHPPSAICVPSGAFVSWMPMELSPVSESQRVVAVFALRSVARHAVAKATSGGPARDALARARHNAAWHARATGPPLRHAEPPSHPPLDALVGSSSRVKEPPHHGSRED
jgi:hypothetical protein